MAYIASDARGYSRGRHALLLLVPAGERLLVCCSSYQIHYEIADTWVRPVVLGADSALGRQLVSDLEGAGYIVIASVESPAAVEELERRSHGYCRVLVLDPGQPEQVPHFLRSLQATLSLRFPTSVSGDPYQGSARTDSQHTSPYIYAVVSLLTLTSTSPAPLEVHKPAAYAQHMQHAHITPVTVVQSLIGALRSVVGGSATRSIVFAIPSQSLSLHSAFTGPEVAAAAATHAAANVLRTELPATRVIVARIGELTAEVEDVIPPQWTAPQRTLYGTQFERHTQRARQRFPYPTSLKHASKSLVDAIAPPRFVFDIIRVPRIARRELYIGARSAAYAVAGSLPELFRDLIIALPDILARLLNVIRPIGPALPQPLPREWQTNRLGGSPRGQTSRRMIESAPGVLQMPEPQTAAPEAAVADQAAAPAGATHHDSDEEASETSSFSGTVSDADLDFESGEDSIATGRTASTGEWVSLRDRRSTNATVTPGFA